MKRLFVRAKYILSSIDMGHNIGALRRLQLC